MNNFRQMILLLYSTEKNNNSEYYYTFIYLYYGLYQFVLLCSVLSFEDNLALV